MRSPIAPFLLASSLVVATASGESVLIDAPGAGSTVPVADAGVQDPDRVAGVMLKGWRENTSLSTMWVRYSAESGEGVGFFRVHVTKGERGYCRFYHVLPRIDRDAVCRLSLRARSKQAMSLQIGVRLCGKPYKWVRVFTPVLREGWRDFVYEFLLPRPRQTLGLFIAIADVGTVDFASIKLEARSREELIAELKAKYPDSGPKNLLRNSRFPLGLQSGWSLFGAFSDGDDVQIDGDPAAIGPSGAPAMRIHAPEGVISPYGWRDMAEVTSAPFSVPLGFMPHTLSVYVRGSGKGKMTVLCEGRRLRETTFELRGGIAWRRVAVTFNPKLLATFYAVNIAFKGTLWLDAMQAAPGDKPIPYTSWMPCEVALACPPGAAAPARIQFDDEPALVRYAVTGAKSGSVLTAKVVNVYDGVKALPPLRLGAAFLQEGELKYDVFQGRPYGPFRIEAWVEDADGQRTSTFNELVVNRLRRPRHWGQDAPDSPFGVHTHSTTRHLLMAKAAGVNWVRLHGAGIQYVGWFYLENERAEWTFYDKAIHRYRKYGLKIIGQLGTTPDWASYSQKSTSPALPVSGTITRTYFLPLDVADFANYVRVVTRRYRGVIDVYDVWNEPWLPIFFSVDFVRSPPKRPEFASFGGGWYVSSPTRADDYLSLQRVAYKAAKSISSDIRILGFNTTASRGSEGRVPGQEWTRAVLDRGGVNSCDVIGYHDYPDESLGYPGDAVANGSRWALDAILKRYEGNAPKPVWMSEGAPIRRTNPCRSGFYNHTLTWEDGEDVIGTSDRLVRFVVSHLAHGSEKVFLYSMGTHRYFGSGAHRALVTEEGYLHPSGAAHSAMAWHLEGRRFVELVTVADHVHAFIFQGRSTAVAVLAPDPRQRASYRLPQAPGVAIRDLFGNPLGRGDPIGRTVVFVLGPTTVKGLRRILGGTGG